jgi:predicted AAA+ superfamily ATPase
MKIDRNIYQHIIKRLIPNKVVILMGARRVGKTFLMKELQKNLGFNTLFLNAEDTNTLSVLEDRSISNYKALLKGVELLIIDEAQVIPDIGKKLKLMIDEIEGIRILVTGSSAFDLLNRAGEPLTGRSFVLNLYPFTQKELINFENPIQTKENLDKRLIYGGYPEIIKIDDEDMQKEYLLNIVNAYLLKDILSIDGIRNSSVMMDLLKLLAHQVGSEVAYDELGRQLGISKNTVEKYLNLLEKVFVIFKVGSYSKNLRKEIRKSKKFYFYDNGILNAIISAFSPFSLRNDKGKLWENYLISERIKFNNNFMVKKNYYFWRTYDQQEIDFIEEYNQELSAFEFKWKKTIAKKPVVWEKGYPRASFQTINRENYLEFIC